MDDYDVGWEATWTIKTLKLLKLKVVFFPVLIFNVTICLHMGKNKPKHEPNREMRVSRACFSVGCHNDNFTPWASLFFLSEKESDNVPKPDCLRQRSPARAPPRVRAGSLLCHGVQRPSMSCSKYNLKIILHSIGMRCQQARIYNSSIEGDWSGGRDSKTMFWKQWHFQLT